MPAKQQRKLSGDDSGVFVVDYSASPKRDADKPVNVGSTLWNALLGCNVGRNVRKK